MKKPGFKSTTRPEKDDAGPLNGLTRKLYYKVPRSLRRLTSPVTFCFRLLQQLRLNVWILQGEELNSGASFTILCAMNEENKHYLARLAFGTTYNEYYLGRTWLWNAHKISGETERKYSIILVEVHSTLVRLLGSNNWMYIPQWVSGSIDLPLKPNTTNNKSIKSDLRRIRKNALGFTVTRSRELFDDFYHNMYTPYINKAHGRGTYLTPYELMKRRFRYCDLLLVTKHHKHIGGILIVYSKTGPRLWSLGIRDGNPDYLKLGAVGALYHFSFKYLKDKGFSKVESGLSRPFLHDGVLRYKKKWDQRITGMSSKMFAQRIITYTTEVRAFLENNPFIIELHGSPNGAVFVDTENLPTPQKLKQIDKDYFYPGLSNLFIYLLQRNNTPHPDRIPPELDKRILFRSVQDLKRKE